MEPSSQPDTKCQKLKNLQSGLLFANFYDKDDKIRYIVTKKN